MAAQLMERSVWVALLASLLVASCDSNKPAENPGLVGLYFSEPNLTAIKAKMVLTSLQQNWDETAFQTTDSSGIWTEQSLLLSTVM